MQEAHTDDLSRLLTDVSVVAIVTQQRLRPVEGRGTPFFPPTYLGADDRPTYCISPTTDGGNVCTVDSVQSQANRIEAAFMAPPYRALIRRVDVTAKLANGEARTLDMLQLGHRLADAAVSFSTLADEAKQAMRAFHVGPEAMARLSPMSLVCGLWESRGDGSQLKVPRALSASITARNVSPLRRMATFSGSFWSKDLGLDEKHSKEGLDAVPAGEALGGVIAAGEIVRTVTLNLIALRQNLKLKPDQELSAAATYLHGLGLVALSMPVEVFLRQGCLLVADGPLEGRLVRRDGSEQAWTSDHETLMRYAQEQATRFGVDKLGALSATFEKERLTQAKSAKDKTAKAK